MGQRGYKQLTERDRVLISQLREKKLSLSEIARRIGKDKSTISRELRRNAIRLTPWDRYFYFCIERFWGPDDLARYLKTKSAEERRTIKAWMHRDAQSWATDRKSRAQQARRKKKPETRRWVIEKLRAGWSPQQISGRSKVDGPQSVSHEYVYDLVHRDKKDGGKLHRVLKRFGRRKQRLGAREYPVTEFAASRRSIETRPAVVAQRARLGDYEADLIVGYRQSGYVLTVIDRTSLATVLRRVPTKHASEILRELKVALRKLGTARTVTVDNGKEFYAHRELEKSERVRVYFTHPYCSTERGTVENANGLVRYYLPKRSSFARLSQKRLDDIEALLNDRPRRCLGYLTPREVHTKKMPSARKRALHL